MHFGKNIKHLRKKKKLTQGELGEAIGMTYSQVGAYEIGRSTPSFEALLKIAQLFNVSIDELVFRDMETEGIGNREPHQPVDEEKEVMAKRLNEMLEYRIRELERHIKENDPEGAEKLGI